MAGEPRDPESYRPPPYQLATWLVLGLGLVLVLGLISLRTDYRPDSSRDYPSRALIPDGAAVLLPSEPLDDEYYPCSDCHEGEPTNANRRELDEEHDDLDFAHGDLWCLHCHDTQVSDSLRLADDSYIPFEESWQLCTQCHGNKLADWRAGVHGKRTGHWRGPKEYRTCVTCHDPHHPPFEPLAPEPPPWRPERIRLDAPGLDEVVDEGH